MDMNLTYRKLEYFNPTEQKCFPLLTVQLLTGMLRVEEANGWRNHAHPDHVDILGSIISELRAASGDDARKRWLELEDMSTGVVRLVKQPRQT